MGSSGLRDLRDCSPSGGPPRAGCGVRLRLDSTFGPTEVLLCSQSLQSPTGHPFWRYDFPPESRWNPRSAGSARRACTVPATRRFHAGLARAESNAAQNANVPELCPRAPLEMVATADARILRPLRNRSSNVSCRDRVRRCRLTEGIARTLCFRGGRYVPRRLRDLLSLARRTSLDRYELVQAEEGPLTG